MTGPVLDAWRDLLVLGRFLGLGLAAAGCVGLLAALVRTGQRGGFLTADLAIAAILLASLAALHEAAGRDLVPVSGRTLFAADSAALHLAAYLAGALVGGAVASVMRRGRRGAGDASA